MKQYIEVGEYGMYDKKRYRCVEDSHSEDCVDFCRGYCDLPESLCEKVFCGEGNRPDHKNVYFRLTRKFRKEAGNE